MASNPYDRMDTMRSALGLVTPKRALDPTTGKPWPSIKEMEAAGLKAKEEAKNAKIRSLAATLSEEQLEGIRIGHYRVGFDEEKKKAYYGAVPGKHPDYPLLKPGKPRTQQVYEQSAAARPQRMVAEGLAELGPVGVPVIGWGAAAAKGAAVGAGALGLTKNMNKWLGAQKTLKTLDDIPDAFSPQVIANRSRKLFGKNPKQLNAQQQAVVWGDLVDKKKFAPGRKVKGQRDEVRQEAAEKLKTEQGKTARTEELAGIKATVEGEQKVATAVGTPAVNVGEGATRTGAPRAVRGEGGGVKGATAKVSAKEGRAVDADLKSQVGRQAEQRTSQPSMAGQTQTPAQVATFARKTKKRVARKATRKANTEAKSISKNADEVPGDHAAAERSLTALRKQLDKIQETASPEVIASARAALTKLENRIANVKGAATAQTKRTAKSKKAAKEAEAVERRAAAQDAVPSDPAAAQANFDSWSRLGDAAEKRKIGKRAAELAKKPWGEMSALERRNFINKAMNQRSQLREANIQQSARARAPKTETRIEKRRRELREQAAEKAKPKPAPGATEEVVEEVVEEAAEAAPRPSGRARLEKRAKQGAGATVSGITGGAAGGYLGGPMGAQIGAMAGPAVVEGFKRAPWATGLGAAATGAGVYAATAEERREKEMLESATRRTADARKKQRGEEKIAASDAADLKARTDELNEKQWYGVDLVIDESGNPAGYPSNWVNAYHELHGAAAEAIRKGKASGDPRYAKIRPSESYKKINRMEDGPLKVEAMAKDFRTIVGMAKSQGYEDLLDVQFDETGTPQDFDVQELLKVMYRVTK